MIRKEKGLTLAYVGRGSDGEGSLRGHLSNIEHGRVSPTLAMLQKIAKNMEIDLPYLATLPGASRRQALIDRTRWMTEEEARELLQSGFRRRARLHPEANEKDECPADSDNDMDGDDICGNQGAMTEWVASIP